MIYFDGTYKSNGNITGANEGDGTLAYQYDNLNRLTNVTNKAASQISYTYDNLGNRLTKTNSTGTTNYAYDDANQLTSESRPGGEVINYTYDENGNTTVKNSNTEGITTYSYDNKNQLVKVTKPNLDVIEFTYNAEGTRTQKTVTASGSAAVSRYYHYDTGGNILTETDENKNVLVRYVRDTSGKAISILQGTNTYYFVYNAHGDVTSLTDESGNTVATYSYDEFGNLKASTGSIYNPLRYSGANNAYYDSETSLYKMGARYYDSSTGRWITRDKIQPAETEPETYHKYTYGKNNPVTYIDPTGFVYARFNGTRFNVYHTNGSYWKGSKAITGVGSYKNYGGPIPPGRWRSYASEIDWIVPPSYGPGRVPLHPIAGTNTYGRSGFFIHGYLVWQNTKGCIRVTNLFLIWFLRLVPKLANQRIVTSVRY